MNDVTARMFVLAVALLAPLACAEDVYVLSQNDGGGGQAAGGGGSGAAGNDGGATGAGGAVPRPNCGPTAPECFCGDMETCHCGGPNHCDMYCGGGCFLGCVAGGSCAMHCESCDAHCEAFGYCTMECLGNCKLSCDPGATCEVLPGPGFVTMSCAENAFCFCSDPGMCLCEGPGCQAPRPGP